jgi:predicted transcriptional regulator
MSDPMKLSRREREIMSALFARGAATVAEVREAMEDPPGMNSVRTFLQILEDKGHVTRKKDGRQFVYQPKQSRGRAGANALGHVLDTFYGGAIDKAVAAHFTKVGAKLDAAEIDRLQALIDAARDGKGGQK